MKKLISLFFIILFIISCSKKDKNDLAKIKIKINRPLKEQKIIGTGPIEFISEINCVAVMVYSPVDPKTSSCKDSVGKILATPHILSESVIINSEGNAELAFAIKKGYNIKFKVVAFKSAIAKCPDLKAITDDQQKQISFPAIIGEKEQNILRNDEIVNIKTNFASRNYIAGCKGSINVVGTVRDIGLPTISSVNLDNNTLTINGSNFISTSLVKVTGPDSFDHTFNVLSSSSSQIIATAKSNISLVAGAIFSVLVTNSYGDTVQTITLQIPQLGANSGEILQWGGSSWGPIDLDRVLPSLTLTAGDGLAGGGDLSVSRSFSVNVDDTTIEIIGDTLKIKDDGVSDAKLAVGISEAKIKSSIQTLSSNYTVLTTENKKVFLLDGNITVILPAASSAGSGFKVTFKRIGATFDAVIDGHSNETIDGKEQIVLKSLYATVTIISNGTQWYIINEFGHSVYHCPTGFIPVPGNVTFSTSDFCVMKYEAKDNAGKPVSQAPNNPWVNITASTAFEKCGSIFESGYSGTFSLITNPEWMTIARNLENVSTNWSSGSVGTGHLARGWTNGSNTLLPSTTDENCIYNNGVNSCSSTGDHKYRRTNNLSNGSVIWDFSGNVYEFVDWDTSAGFTLGPIGVITPAWKELSELTAEVLAINLQSAGGYTSVQEAGRWYPTVSGGGATMRGGSWNDESNAGIFTLRLDTNVASSYPYIGFRCVYRE